MRITYEQPMPGQGQYLAHLASADILGLLENRMASGIAAVSETEDKRIPVGLMIARKEDDGKMNLQWLYISKDYRGKGIASTFLKILQETAERYHAGEVTSTLYQHKMGDWSYEDMADFLTRHGMNRQEETDGPWIFSGDSLSEEPFIQKSAQKADRLKNMVVSLSELTATERRRLFAEFLPRVKVREGAIALDVSCAARSGEKWEGIFIAEKYGDTYIPRYLKADGRQAEVNLLTGFAIRLYNHIKMTEYLMIDQTPEEMIHWMDKLFPEAGRQQALTTAQSIA